MPLKRGEEEEGLPLNKIPSKQYQRKEYTNIEEPQLNSGSFITERVMAVRKTGPSVGYYFDARLIFTVCTFRNSTFHA